MLFQIMLEFFSKGAEHGHMHHHKKNFPWMIIISLCIHAFLEGMPLNYDKNLLWGVSIHKIPIGLVLGTMLFQQHSALLAKIMVFSHFCFNESFGSYTALFFDSFALYRHFSPFVLGVLLHISTTILFESSEGHSFNLQKFLSIVLGIGIWLPSCNYHLLHQTYHLLRHHYHFIQSVWKQVLLCCIFEARNKKVK